MRPDRSRASSHGRRHRAGARRIRLVLSRRATETFVGRSRELAVLRDAIGRGSPLVVHVHGIPGIGKSSLLDACAREARARGATVVRLDCRAMEPTPRGFLHELATAVGGESDTPEKAARRLARLGPRVVLALDNYEVFRLMDAWLRQVFVPTLGDSVRVLLFGRQPAIPGWAATPGWQALFRSLSLGPLADREATELLRHLGVAGEEARRINRFARGHPLALTLAAAASREAAAPDLEDVALPRVVDELAGLYLADVSDPLTREALEAASVVRRSTQPLLRAMLPRAAPQDAFERLRALPFVERARDGLVVHDAVQRAIAAALRAADPDRHRTLRLAAWRQLRVEVHHAAGPDLWRSTADILYLL